MVILHWGKQYVQYRRLRTPRSSVIRSFPSNPENNATNGRTSADATRTGELLRQTLVCIYKVIRVKFQSMDVSRAFHGLHSLLKVVLKLGQCILVR
jgi:hypothetical protein